MITFDRKAFTDKFTAVAAVCPARTTVEILKNVLLVSNGKGPIELLASDGEMNIRTSIEATCEPVKMLLPCDRLRQILKELTSETIRLELSGGKLIVLADYSTFVLQTMDAAGVPEIPEFDFDHAYEVGTSALAAAIKATSFATDENSTRYALSGISLEFLEDNLICAATDSRRLAVYRLLWASAIDEQQVFGAQVVPKRAAVLVQHVAESSGEAVAAISLEQNSIAFQIGDTAIGSQLVQGRFPDWRTVVPSGAFNGEASIVAKHLLSLVRQAAITTDNESRGVDLKFTSEELIVSSGAKEIGQAKVRMPINYPGREMTITLDGRYLAEYLRAVGDRTIEIKLIAADDRVLCQSGEYRHVLMPLARE